LHLAGLPVPEFVALITPHDQDPERWSAITRLLERGPVIVRTALFDEDREHTAAAGLGASIPDCVDLAAVRRALARITESLADPWLREHLGPDPRAQVLVQRQISGPWLAVVAQGLTRHVEIHRTDCPAPRTAVDPHARTEPHVAARPLARKSQAHEPLAAGATPSLAAPLELLPEPLRRAIAPLCDRVTAALPATPHGLDLELAADDDGAAWVVQARPLTRPLHPEWPAFAAATAAELPGLAGLWTLDAEHNPAPLSPAHAGLISHLSSERPDLVTARVLAGWLYEPTRPRAPPTTTAADALHALQHVHIPAARAWLTAWDRELAAADADALATLLDRAAHQLLKILALHAALRVPASPSPTPGPALPAGPRGPPRRVARRVGHRQPAARRPVPSDLAARTCPKASPPNDATLLHELDDHLFALGLAPLRRLYLRAAALLAISPTDIFLLPPLELQSALRDPTIRASTLPTRRAAQARKAELYPPLQLLNGLPVPAPARTYLQGLAIGRPFTGPLHARRDLEDLLADPIPADAILAIPALTAQAAVALHALIIRAVCCEHGGAMSHAALMARELGLSALIGCRGCTSLPAGTRVHLDTRTARLRREIT
jgi:phosphohistidine swiveling domain-containing protein